MRVSSVLLVADNVLTPEVMKEVSNQSLSTTANQAENSSTEDVCTAPVMVKSNGVDKFECMRGYSNPLNLLEESFVVHIIDITCVAGNFVCAMTIKR